MNQIVSIRVAIVEDKPEYRRSLIALLDSEPGYSLSGQYSSMERAFEGLAAASPLPEAMLIDVGLPGISGIEGIRLLRERYPGIALIVLTVFDDDSRIFKAICAGAHGYLLKTSPPRRLLDGIKEVLAGGAPMSPGVARRVIDLFRDFRPPAPTPELTPHELRLLRMIMEGHNATTAARELGVSPNTIRFHIKSIYSKLEVHSRAEAVSKALRHGLVR